MSGTVTIIAYEDNEELKRFYDIPVGLAQSFVKTISKVYPYSFEIIPN